jgi:hypothetical protein
MNKVDQIIKELSLEARTALVNARRLPGGGRTMPQGHTAATLQELFAHGLVGRTGNLTARGATAREWLIDGLLEEL